MEIENRLRTDIRVMASGGTGLRGTPGFGHGLLARSQPAGLDDILALQNPAEVGFPAMRERFPNLVKRRVRRAAELALALFSLDAPILDAS